MGALSAAALLTHKGLKVRVLEQNYLPGGCTSSYWRKGFVFETGATTLVGLGKGMPLQYILDETGISLNTRKLTLPMQVRLSDGETINRYEDLEEWITEAERVFGKNGQRAFWTESYAISQFVWDNALKQRLFPPSKFKDVINAVKNFSFEQLKQLPNAFLSVDHMLKKHGLYENQRFREFVNEQLLITAQNKAEEVNFLFGATALCYTNFPNYYIDGGLLNLVQPFVDFIESGGGKVHLRESVQEINRIGDGYQIITNTCQYQSEFLISGLPINNTVELFPELNTKRMLSKLMKSEQLNSAFQMGIGFKPHKHFDTLHHQIHLNVSFKEIDSLSIFVSLSHPDDKSRSDIPGLMVMSVSTHVPDPENNLIDGKEIEKVVIQALEKYGFLLEENIIYQHSSTPKSWFKWTGRKWGFVGGYPQYMNVRPWNLLDARLDGHKAYLVGDTAYPGQGIPGVSLSGIIAVQKMSADWKL